LKLFEFNAEVVRTLYAGANLVYEKESYAVTTKDRLEAHSVLIRAALLEHAQSDAFPRFRIQPRSSILQILLRCANSLSSSAALLHLSNAV